MDPIAAISAAIRERLLSGRPAPLPGLGALVRQHVASRIEERADGTRMLLPPGETIGLDSSSDAPSLAEAFGRMRGVNEGGEAESAYAAAMDQLEAQLAIKGEVRLPGVGLLRRTSGGVVLGVEADLLAAVNRTYEGLAPVGAGPTLRGPQTEPSATPPTTAQAALAPVVTTVPSSDTAPASAEPTSKASASGPPEQTAPPASAPPSAPAEDVPDAETLGPVTPGDAQFDDGDPSIESVLEAGGQASPDIEQARFETSPTGGLEARTAASLPAQDPEADPTSAVPDSSSDAASSTESAFVDEGTLDDDLDGVLAVPFGESEGPIRDALPPTPESADPSAVQDPAPALRPDPDEVWTAPVALASSEAMFEDADFEVVSEDDAEPPTEEGGPIVERIGPEAELASLFESSESPGDAPDDPDLPAATEADLRLGGSDAVPEGTPVLEESAPEPEVEPGEQTAPGRPFRWWPLALLLLAAVIAAFVWFWPRATPTAQDAPDRAAPTASTVSTPALPVGQDDSTAVASLDEQTEAGIPADPSAGVPADRANSSDTPTAASSPTAAPRASGPAVLPPRVAGLSAAETAALSGRDPVDPDAEAYTLAVLATRTRSSAQAFADRFEAAGYRVGVLEASSGRRWRVGVGQFPTKEMALRLRDRLPPQAPSDTWALDLRTL